MPSMAAPRETRNRARSWTCGSDAALRSTVVPLAAVAAIRAFSVPVTLGSSRKMSAPTRCFASTLYSSPTVTSAPSRSSARKWVSTRRRPITSPPGGGRLTRPKRASIGPAKRIDARMRARFGRVSLPPPGGDVIGRRRVDTHFLALERLGAEVTVGAAYQLEAKSLVGADIFLDETSVTATENALMAAVSARGTTTLRNAACEPHVQDLARFLSDLGARIQGVGTNTLTIEGGLPLAAAGCTVGPDHIEIGSFIGLAAVTNGAIMIDGVRGEDLRSILLGFERLGVRPRLDGTQLIVDAGQERRIRPDLGGHVPKLEDGPWPAFPADLMSIAIVVASQCEGILLVFEKLFESRLFFVDKLIGMGARIVLCDPHRAVIAGPSPLHGGVVESPDIRAGMAMLLAALAAQGDSVIHNIGQIERGYERIDERLRAVGAQIARSDDGAKGGKEGGA